MENRIFHTATIGGYEFTGLITMDGPYLACEALRGGVALGICGLKKFRPDERYKPSPSYGWWVVKYESEARIDLHVLTDEEAKALSDEFGIVIDDSVSLERVSYPLRHEYFFTSPCWEGLKAWVKKHPRIAEEYSAYQDYLPSWYQRAKL